MSNIGYNRMNPYSAGALFDKHVMPYIRDYGERVLGYRQYKNTQASLITQMDYEQYLKRANQRALADWHKNVPGRTIKYPEFSYSGQIRRADTSIARAGLDYDTAYSNYAGNIIYRTAGLYGISSKLSRSL